MVLQALLQVYNAEHGGFDGSMSIPPAEAGRRENLETMIDFVQTQQDAQHALRQLGIDEAMYTRAVSTLRGRVEGGRGRAGTSKSLASRQQHSDTKKQKATEKRGKTIGNLAAFFMDKPPSISVEKTLQDVTADMSDYVQGKTKDGHLDKILGQALSRRQMDGYRRQHDFILFNRKEPVTIDKLREVHNKTGSVFWQWMARELYQSRKYTRYDAQRNFSVTCDRV